MVSDEAESLIEAAFVGIFPIFWQSVADSPYARVNSKRNRPYWHYAMVLCVQLLMSSFFGMSLLTMVSIFLVRFS